MHDSIAPIPFVDLRRQYQALRHEIDAAIAAVVQRADFVLGAELHRFEEAFAAYCGAPYAVGVDSGASALELALRALGVGPGDEVIVPANSFIASATAVSAAGATPVFADVSPASYNLDVGLLAGRLTPHTRAIIPVHLYGLPADMDAVMAFAGRHGLAVVEDACQAHGARYKGRRAGSIGHAAAFSFYPGKNLGAYGDGGAVVTADAAIAERVRVLRNCGQREKYHHVEIAGNHRLDTLQAAVLLVKLPHLDHWNELRRQIACWYDYLLTDAEVVLPAVSPGCEPVYHLYVIQVAGRDRLQAHLRQAGIATGIHYPIPIHRQEAYASLGHGPGSLPVAEGLAPRLLSLPIFAELEPEEIARVAEQIAGFLADEAERYGPLAQLAVGG